MSEQVTDVVGRELAAGMGLLSAAGEQVCAVVQFGLRPVVEGDGRAMIFRQRRLAEGCIELTTCEPKSAGNEGGTAQDD